MRHLDDDRLLELYFYLMHAKMASLEAGVLSESGLRAALARPLNAAAYEDADGVRQTSYLYHGLATAHGFSDGNKRIAFLALLWLLENNDLGRIVADEDELIQFGLDAAAGRLTLDEVESWIRSRM